MKVLKVVQSKIGKRAEGDKKCFRCGREHRQGQCLFLDAVCYNCGKKGHISRTSETKSCVGSSKWGVRNVEKTDDSETDRQTDCNRPKQRLEPVTGKLTTYILVSL